APTGVEVCVPFRLELAAAALTVCSASSPKFVSRSRRRFDRTALVTGPETAGALTGRADQEQPRPRQPEHPADGAPRSSRGPRPNLTPHVRSKLQAMPDPSGTTTRGAAVSSPTVCPTGFPPIRTGGRLRATSSRGSRAHRSPRRREVVLVADHRESSE